MNRVLCCLVLAVTLTSLSGTIVRGQQASKTGDPGILKRNFSPVTYLKASNPRADAKLGLGSALTGRSLAMSGDGNTIAVAAWGEDGGSTGVNGNQADNSVRSSGAAYIY